MTPVAKCGIYGATKAAMINLAKVMALEEAEHKVRVNVICPGAIMTEILNGQGIVDSMR